MYGKFMVNFGLVPYFLTPVGYTYIYTHICPIVITFCGRASQMNEFASEKCIKRNIDRERREGRKQKRKEAGNEGSKE